MTSDIDLMVPKLMHLLRFHGQMTIDEIRNYTGLGRASIREAVTSLVKNGLIKKQGSRPMFFQLSDNSKYWLGWNRGFQ